MSVPDVVGELRSEETGVQIELRSDDTIVVSGFSRLISFSQPGEAAVVGRTLLALFHRQGECVETAILSEKMIFRFIDVSISKPAWDTVWFDLIGS